MADEFSVQTLLTSREMTLRDVVCRGMCRHRSAEECVSTTHLVFPYRGTYVRHVGQDNAVGSNKGHSTSGDGRELKGVIFKSGGGARRL